MSSVIIPDYEAIPTRLFRLRWRFEFAGGKAPKTGIWDGTSSNFADSAAAVDKTGLLRVLIQAEDRLNNVGAMITLVDCPGQEYASMQWEAYSRVPAFFQGAGISPRAYVSGLSILTRDEKITAWVNGKITRTPLTENDKQWSILEHSLGSGK